MTDLPFTTSQPLGTVLPDYIPGTAAGGRTRSPWAIMLYGRLISEAVAVGRASGVAFPADAVETAMALIVSLPAAGKTSMRQDYERGSRVELNELTGAVRTTSAT